MYVCPYIYIYIYIYIHLSLSLYMYIYTLIYTHTYRQELSFSMFGFVMAMLSNVAFAARNVIYLCIYLSIYLSISVSIVCIYIYIYLSIYIYGDLTTVPQTIISNNPGISRDTLELQPCGKASSKKASLVLF